MENRGLFLSFLKLGVTAFGGPAMVAHVKELAVKRKHWIDEDTFKNGLVLCQSIPGATVMQLVAYVGMRVNGIPGALVSYFGFALPAFILMLVLSAAYAGAHALPNVVSVFNGLQVIVVAILAHATYTFGRDFVSKYRELSIAVLSAGALWAGMNPFFVVLCSAALGAIMVKTGKSAATNSAIQKPALLPKATALLIAAFLSGLVVLYFVDTRLFRLSLLMAKVDLFAFGGGFSALPLMFQEVVSSNNWLDSKTFMEGIALGQVTPGPIVITATFVGYLVYGLSGAVVATVSIFSPSFLMVITISPYFDRLKASPYFTKITKGVLASFAGLLLFITFKFAFEVHWEALKVLLWFLSFAALIKKVDILYIVLAGSVISVFLF